MVRTIILLMYDFAPLASVLWYRKNAFDVAAWGLHAKHRFHANVIEIRGCESRYRHADANFSARRDFAIHMELFPRRARRESHRIRFTRGCIIKHDAIC